MPTSKITKSAIAEESDDIQLELHKDASEDDGQIVKQLPVEEYADTTVGKRGLRLVELKSPPQIDGNLSIGTYFYLQRHVFMIFTDVILALLLASYGHDNILYYVINGIRLVLFYGLCYTGPSVYNSGFIGLKLKKFKASGLTLNLIIESIPALLYLTVIIVQSKLGYMMDLIYIIWAIGIAADFLSLIVSDGFSIWYRTSIQPEDLTMIISKKSYIEQLNSDPYDRMRVLTLAAFGWGGSQLFPSRKGVGMPDLYVSVDYNIIDFLVGMMGILIIFFMMRSYVASNATYFCLDQNSKKLNILIGLQRLLHVFVHTLLFLFLNLLKQCIKDIWDNNNRYPGSGYYFNYAQVTGYQFALWRSFPYPTKDTFSNFLRHWAANQTANTTPPPGLYSIPSNMSGTSLLNYSSTDPGIIFCSTLGLIYIFLLAMHWTSKIIEMLQNSQNDESPTYLYGILIKTNSFIKMVSAAIFFSLAVIDNKYINILWKMVIITVATFFQVMWDDSQRVLSYGRSFA